MKTKNIIITLALTIIIATIGWFIYSYITSFHKVAFTVSSDVSEATLHKVVGEGVNHQIISQEVSKITSGEEKTLQNGDYYVVPKGEKITDTPIEFTVTGQDTKVDINPDYSSTYLESQKQQEASKVAAALRERFDAMKDYTTAKGQLFKKGDWYGVILTKKVSDPREEPDFYRAVLHKENGQWKPINLPQIVLTSDEFKNVPVDVLRSINQLTP